MKKNEQDEEILEYINAIRLISKATFDEGATQMDGLIIKPCWLERILERGKRIEVRGHQTKKIGEKIYLIESKGKVVATAVISKVIKFDEQSWENTKSLHQVEITYSSLKLRYKTPYGWCLEDVEPIEPFDYVKHQGAVIWVKDVEKVENA